MFRDVFPPKAEELAGPRRGDERQRDERPHLPRGGLEDSALLVLSQDPGPPIVDPQPLHRASWRVNQLPPLHRLRQNRLQRVEVSVHGRRLDGLRG